jgi:hypothetical protein
MGGNIAFQRRQPVRPQYDETVGSERYGVCIRKTDYREDQQDRVSKINVTEIDPNFSNYDVTSPKWDNF